MVERSDNSGASRIGLEGEQGISIPLTSLDDFAVAEGLDRVDLMKIDVEGFEEKLIQGAETMIARFRPTILIELWPPGLEKIGTSVSAVVDRLRALGYDFYEAHRAEFRPVERFPDGVDPVNIFCLPKKV
jgi:hypothetical protein